MEDILAFQNCDQRGERKVFFPWIDTRNITIRYENGSLNLRHSIKQKRTELAILLLQNFMWPWK